MTREPRSWKRGALALDRDGDLVRIGKRDIDYDEDAYWVDMVECRCGAAEAHHASFIEYAKALKPLPPPIIVEDDLPDYMYKD